MNPPTKRNEATGVDEAAAKAWSDKYSDNCGYGYLGHLSGQAHGIEIGFRRAVEMLKFKSEDYELDFNRMNGRYPDADDLADWLESEWAKEKK